MGMLLGFLGALICVVLIFALPFTFYDGWIVNFLLLIGAILSLVVGLRYDAKRRIDFGEQQKNKIKNLIEKLNGFNTTQEFISPNLESGIAIDEDNKKVCIIENKHKNHGELEMSSKFEYQSFVYSFSELIQSEIIKDGVTINKTSRGGQIGGALIGGALAGGVGAIIGGLSASSESKSTVTKLELQIVVNNTRKSAHKVIFMSPHALGNFITSDVENEIIHWHNLFTHILGKTDESISSNVDTSIITITDELKKLAELRNDGILTEEEFNQQKQKLLS